MTILNKLQEIQLKLKVEKGQKNAFGGYNYRSAEDILEAIKPIQKEYGVVFKITEELIVLGEYLAIKSTAKVIDLSVLDKESSVSSDAYAVLDFDAKGMQNPQRTGSASSYAKKYALGNLLLIDDTKDSDATNTHEKQTLKLGNQFNVFKAALKSGKVKITDIEKKYILTDEIKKALTQ